MTTNPPSAPGEPPPSDPGPTSDGPSLRRLWWAILGASAFFAVIGAFAVAAVGAGTGTGTTAPTTAPSIAQPKIAPSDYLPESGAWIGMATWPRDGDWSQDGLRRRWDQIETAVGRTLDIGHAYHRWNERDLITWREHWNAELGRLSLVSWSQTQVTPVVEGRWDEYIATQADLVKDFGEPVLIRWFWEMDGRKRRAVAEDPETWIAAWRHIVEIFRARGVENAEFVWCPNAWAFDIGVGPDWYPGDDWVDWLCADGYNWAPGIEGADWTSFAEVFRTFYDWAERRNKPIILGEFGSMEREPGEKAAWIRAIPGDLERRLPRIDALVWFDTPGEDGDWWLDTTPESLEAWVDIVNDAYFPGITLGCR